MEESDLSLLSVQKDVHRCDLPRRTDHLGGETKKLCHPSGPSQILPRREINKLDFHFQPCNKEIKAPEEKDRQKWG